MSEHRNASWNLQKSTFTGGVRVTSWVCKDFFFFFNDEKTLKVGPFVTSSFKKYFSSMSAGIPCGVAALYGTGWKISPVLRRSKKCNRMGRTPRDSTRTEYQRTLPYYSWIKKNTLSPRRPCVKRFWDGKNQNTVLATKKYVLLNSLMTAAEEVWSASILWSGIIIK